MFDVASLVLGLLGLGGISAKDFAEKIQRRVRVASDLRFKQKRESVRHHMLLETLAKYYGVGASSRNSPSMFRWYRVSIGEQPPIRGSIVVRPEWVGLDNDLARVRCSLEDRRLSAPSFEPSGVGVPEVGKGGIGIWDPRVATDRVAQYVALVATSGSSVWDQDLYRLVDVRGFPDAIAVSLAQDSFFRYRYGVGLLNEELMFALMDADFDSDRVVLEKSNLLPLREYFLPNPARFEDYESRVCAGGVHVTFAIARQEGDFIIPTQLRSMKVSEGQGLRSIIPVGYHQPMVDENYEVALKSTVFRELYEELFGGKEVEKDVDHVVPDWYYDKSPPLRWLRDHQSDLTLRCTGFSVNLLFGNGEFGILLVVHDPAFWSMFGSDMTHNWEAMKDRGMKAVELHSTRNLTLLTDLMENSPWASPGLASIVEGLTQLKTLEPSRVSDLEFRRELHAFEI